MTVINQAICKIRFLWLALRLNNYILTWKISLWTIFLKKQSFIRIVVSKLLKINNTLHKPFEGVAMTIKGVLRANYKRKHYCRHCNIKGFFSFHRGHILEFFGLMVYDTRKEPKPLKNINKPGIEPKICFICFCCGFYFLSF